MAPGKRFPYKNRCQNPSQANGNGPTHQSSSRPSNAHGESNQQKPLPAITTPQSTIQGAPQSTTQDQSTTQGAPQLTAIQMIRSFTKEWNPDLHHNKQPFTKLPRDMALCIMDHLKDPVDKMSLALTTKTLWEWSRGVLKLEDFDLQQVLPMRVSERRGTIKPWPYFRSYRWRLVERLENEYWKACAGCLRLHPKTEFFPSELKQPANERYCRAPGLIQICPHLLLTYKKLETLQKVLAEQGEQYKQRRQNTDFDKYLLHECTMRAGSSKFVISTQPFITEREQNLVFRQKYTIHMHTDNLKADLDRVGSRGWFPNLCPHRSILTHCLDMLDEKSPWNNDMIIKDERDHKADVSCKWCGTYFSGFKRYAHSSSHKVRIDFFASKIIGKDLGLRDCLNGHGVPNELQYWINNTQLANIVSVTDSLHYGCKCRKKCRKLGYLPISTPSPRASLPDTTWKGDEPVSDWKW
jgi:hypothetical protein